MPITCNDRDHSKTIKLELLPIRVATRRKLINSGYSTLDELLTLDVDALDSILSIDETNELLVQLDLYKRDQDSFFRMLDTMKEARKQDGKKVTKPAKQSSAKSKIQTTQVLRGASNAFIQYPEARFLKAFNTRAYSAISVTADNAEEAIVSEALDALSIDIPNLRSNVIKLFKIYRSFSRSGTSSVGAVRTLLNEAPDAFLIYMVDSAQRNFTGTSVWVSVFDELGITDQASEIEIKKGIYERISYWGFKVYKSSESALRYFYTLLLHAGLAETDWISIWDKLLIPVAKDIRIGRLPFGSYPTALDLIRLASNENGPYHLANKSASNLLTKAPEIVGPLLEEALDIASSYVDSAALGDKTYMIPRKTLPSVAMDALRAATQPKKYVAANKPSLIYFSAAELRLDATNSDKPMVLHWDSMRFPEHYVGTSIQYEINGMPLAIGSVKPGVGVAQIEEVSINLPPEVTYEIRVSLRGDKVSSKELTSSQTIKANKPGVYEFVTAPDGTLRQKKHALRKNRDIHYLLAPGYSIKPVSGMTLLNTESLANDFCIKTFSVEQAASAEIIDASSTCIFAWCEGFKTQIDRSQTIGQNGRGDDLYPYSQGHSKGKFNVTLPAIEVKSLTKNFNRRQIGIQCYCDDKQVAVQAREIRGSEQQIEAISVRLDQSDIPNFVDSGTLRIIYKPTKQKILEYRFSVVPIKCISLDSATLSDTAIIAKYKLDASRSCAYKKDRCTATIRPSEAVFFEVPLSDEYLSILVSPASTNPSPAIECHILLAGLAITFPKLPSSDPTCLPDKHTLEDLPATSGEVIIHAMGRRSHRGIYASLGYTPLLYKMLPTSSLYRVNPFLPIGQTSAEDGINAVNLSLLISYLNGAMPKDGKLPNCELELAKLYRGYALGNVSILANYDGASVCFDHSVTYDLTARIRYKIGRKYKILQDNINIEAGHDRFLLSRASLLRLNSKKTLRLEIVTRDLFGDVDYSNAQVVTIKR